MPKLEDCECSGFLKLKMISLINKKTVATNNPTVFLFNFAFNYLNIICYGN